MVKIAPISVQLTIAPISVQLTIAPISVQLTIVLLVQWDINNSKK